MVVAIFLKMGQFIIKNRNINVKPVKDNLSPITLKYTSTIPPKELIDKLLLEKISLAGIIRVTGVSENYKTTLIFVMHKFHSLSNVLKKNREN